MSNDNEVAASIGAVLENDVPLFQFLRQLDKSGSTHRHLVRAGVVIEQLQNVAVAALPYHPWSTSLTGLYQALLIVALPMYDPNHLHGGWQATAGVMCALLSVLLVALGIAVVAIIPSDDGVRLLPPQVVSIASAIVHSFAGWLLVPVISLCASFYFCTPDGTSSVWDTDLGCSSSAGIALRVIAVIFTVVVSLIALFARSIFYDANPGSRHLAARAHPFVDVLSTLHRVTAVILWHYFFAKSELMYFAAYVAIVSLLMATATIFFSSYYSVSAQRIVVISYVIACLTGIFAAVAHSGTDEVGRRNSSQARWWSYVIDNHIDTAVWLGVICPVGILIGAAVARLRFSGQFKSDMDLLIQEGKLRSRESYFPSNLPTSDNFASPADAHLLRVEFALTKGSVGAVPGEDETVASMDDAGLKWHFTTPVLDAVYAETDVELATRFLYEFCSYTGLQPSDYMLSFAARIYIKGRMRFPQSGTVCMHFANFLFFQAKKINAAHAELQAMRRGDVSLRVRYESYKLNLQAESLLHLKKKVKGGEISEKLKRYHRDTLQAISDFWSLLTSEDCDSNSLGLATTAVIANRDSAANLYVRLLSHNPQNIEYIALYSKFCEDVLLNPEATGQTTQCLAEVLELRAAHATRGARANNAADTTTPLPLGAATDNAADAAAASEGGGSGGSGNTAMASRVDDVKLHSFIFSAFAAGVAIAVLIFSLLYSQARIDTSDAVFYAGRLRAVSAEAGLAATALADAVASSQSTATVSQLQRQVTAAAEDMRRIRNALFAGGLRPVASGHSDFRELALFVAADTTTSVKVSMWSLLGLTIESLTSFAATPLPDATSVLAPLRQDLDMALNRTVALYRRDLELRAVTAWAVMGSLLVVIAVATLVTFTRLIGSVNGVTRTKEEILALFSYIRRDRLVGLHLGAKKKAIEFDTFVALEDKEKAELILQERPQANLDNVGSNNGSQTGGQMNTSLGDGGIPPAPGDDDDAAAKEAAAASGSGGDERIITLSSGLSGADHLWPPQNVQVALNTIIICALAVCVGLGVLVKFPALTRDARLKGVTTAMDGKIEWTNTITDTLRDARLAIATGRWSYGDVAPALTLDAIAVEMRAQLLLVGANQDAIDKGLAAQRKLAAVSEALSIALALASSLPLIPSASAAQQQSSSQVAAAVASLNWTSTTVLQIDRYLRDPYVVPLNDVALRPIRRRPSLSGRATDLALPPAARLRLAVDLVYCDMVWRVATSALIDIAAACDLTASVVTDVGRNVLTAATAVIIGLAVGLVLPCAAILLHREMQSNRFRNEVSLTGLLLWMTVLLAVALTVVAGVALDDYRSTDVTHHPVVEAAAAEHRAAGRLANVSLAAEYFVMRGADIFWLDRLLSTVTVDYVAAPSAPRPISAYLDPRTTLVAVPGVPNDMLDQLDANEAAIRSAFTSIVESATRLCYEGVIPNQYVINRTLIGSALSSWDLTETPDMVDRWLRYFGPGARSTLNTAATVLYPASLISGPGAANANNTAELTGNLSTATASTIEIAAAVSAFDARARPTPPSLREAFSFAGTSPIPLLSVQTTLGQYVEASIDVVQPAVRMVRTAVSSITSLPRVDAEYALRFYFHTAVKEWSDARLATLNGVNSRLDQVDAAVIGVSAVAAVTAICAMIALATRNLSDTGDAASASAAAASSSGSPGEGGQGADETATMASRRSQSSATKRRSTVTDQGRSPLSQAAEPGIVAALLFSAVLICAGLVYMDYDDNTTAGALSARSSSREYIISATLLEAERIAQDVDVTVARMRLRTLVKEATNGLDEMYFVNGRRIAGFNRDSASDDLLYASTATSDALAKFVAVQSALCPNIATTYFLGVASTLTNASAATVRFGVAAAFDDVYIRLVRNLIDASARGDTLQQISTIVSTLRSLAPSLIRAVQSSSDEYRSNVHSTFTTSSTRVVACAAVIAAVAVVYSFVVMVRFVSAMRHIESSARTMIQLIPSQIVEATPAIQSYLDNGGDNSLQDAGASSEALVNDAISNMSTLPVIAIDTKGTIIKFTQAAERAFGYTASEVTGLNIKVLTPPDIAEQHDGFLSRYLRTRQKHVIDQTRRSRAMRKSGEIFPVELSVKELDLGAGDSVYIGFVRDQSTAVQLSLQGVLNKYVLQMSDAAIVAIDDRGTIILASRRVSELFGFEPHELLRENVRMLMPSEIAMQHDGYLQRYRETGVKRVIGVRNTLTAQKKNGESFRVALTVREIKSEEHGESSTFVATISDVTQEEATIAQSQIHDLISDLSPTPIIAITDDGTIVKFSRAASRLFGYPQEDVVESRQNIQTLMPSIYGDHTDFIKDYRRREGKDSRVVGYSRNVLGMKRNRTVFPVELAVREVRNEGVAPIFLAFVTDASEKVEAAVNTAITDAAVNHSLIPLIAITLDGTITRFNEAAVQLFGYTHQETLGHNIKMLMPRHVAEKHDGFLARYLQTRVRTVIDRTRHVLGRKKDGSAVPLELNIREVSATDSTPASYIGYARDITMERQARRQFQINDLVSELSTVPIIAIDPMGIVQSFSRAAEEVFGYHAMEIMGSNIKILMVKELAAQHDAILARYHATGVKKVIDTTTRNIGVRKDGRKVPLDLSVREIIDPKGGKSSFVAFARDTSQDGALDAATRLGNVIRDMSIVPLLEMSPDCIVNYVNEAFTIEFGYTSADVVGQNIRMIMPEEVAAQHDNYVLKYLKGQSTAGIVGSTRRVVGKRKDGSLVSLELSLGEFKSQHTDRHFFIGYLLNVTEQLQLEQANSTVNAITNMSTTPILAIDGGGTVITFNEAAERTFGYSATEVRGQNVKIIMPAHIAEKHDGYLRSYARTGLKNVIDQVVRQQGRRKDGTIIPVELRVKELNSAGNTNADTEQSNGNGNQQSKLFVGYCRDATSDLALERETRMFDMVLALAATPVIVMDTIGTVQSINPAGCTLFGYAEADVVGKNIKMLMPEHIARMHDKFLSAYLLTGEKRVIDTTRAVEAKRRDGTVFPAEISVREILPVSGSDKGVVYAGFLRDLSNELAVQQRAQQNTAVSNLSLHPLIVITATGIITSFSTSAVHCFGWTAEEAVGQNVKMLMPDETAERHDSILAAFAARNQGTTDNTSNVRRTVRAKRKNGEEFIGRILVRPLTVPTPQGDVRMFVGYVEDITQQEAAIRDMKITEYSLSLASVPVIEIETDGTIRTFNKSAADAFGYTAQETVGQNIKMLMPENIAIHHDGFLSKYLTTGVKHVIGSRRTVFAKRKNGTDFPAVISVYEVKSSSHHYYIGYIEDQTQVLALQNVRAINDAAMTSSLDPFISIDEIGTILSCNAACEMVFGYAPSELIGNNVRMIMAEPNRGRHDSYLSRYKETGIAKVLNTTTRGLIAQRKDGTTTVVDLQVRELEASGKKIFLGSFRDTTAQSRKSADRAVALAAERGCVKPLITIDHIGTILRMNKPAVEIFGYQRDDELLGRNIKVLMPREIADRHDGFLRTYRETGVKHVIDSTRQVTGQRKNGTMVEVKLEVKEVTVDCTQDNRDIDFGLMGGAIGKQTVFVASLEDVASTNMQQLSGVLNEAVMQLLPLPVLTIDEKGTILSFNKAAEETFEFAARQVLKRNVSLLMPSEVQKKHDGYLERYKKTGIKTIIDNSREVIGETKSGQPVRLRIQVRELKRPREGRRSSTGDADDMESIYVGFLKVVDAPVR